MRVRGRGGGSFFFFPSNIRVFPCLSNPLHELTLALPGAPVAEGVKEEFAVIEVPQQSTQREQEGSVGDR